MKSRKTHIIDAALQVFSQFGVKRTSMSDIASAAGISRQTLYNAFANKDVLLKETVLLWADRGIEAIESGFCHADTLDEKLDVFFQHVAIDAFDLLNAAPNMRETVEVFEKVAPTEMEDGNQRGIALIAEALDIYRDRIEMHGLTVEQLADYILRSAVSAKHVSKDRPHLRAQLSVLKASVLTLTGAKSEKEIE